MARNVSSLPLHNRRKNEGKDALVEFVHAHAYKDESCETRANQTRRAVFNEYVLLIR